MAIGLFDSSFRGAGTPGSPGVGSTQRGLQMVEQNKNVLEEQRMGLQTSRDAALLDSLVKGSQVVSQIQDPMQKLEYLRQRKDQLQQAGLDTSHTDEGIAMLEAGDLEGFNQVTQDILELGREVSGTGLPAGLREFQSLVETAELTPEETVRAARVSIGLDPRAVGSASQTIADKGTIAEVAATEKELQGAKEEGKLIAQKNLKPEVEAAVTQAVARAKANAEIVESQRSNSAAFNLYETAMSGLTNALGGTRTGPFVGWLPAITANQQIAQGAVAAMAPVLKQIFRTAGEGTFTDKDQELLLDMVPTRDDLQEARAAKLRNIDAIIRAKLQQPSSSGQPSPQQGQQQGESPVSLFSPALGREVTDEEIQQTLAENPGVTREQLLQTLGIQ